MHIALSVRKIVAVLNEKRLADNDLLAVIEQFRATSSSMVAIEERFRRFAIDPPPEEYDRLVRDKDQQRTKSFRASLVRYDKADGVDSPTQSQYPTSSTGCSLNCSCKCHKKYGFRSPYFASTLVGRVNVIYTGASMADTLCSSPHCSRLRGFMFNLNYSFPRWLLFRMLHILGSTMGDPTFMLSVPKVISQDAKIFEMARLGDIESMKEIFSHRWASPLVVTEHGETLIQETIHNGFPHAARFLIQMGANPEVENDVGVLPAQEAWDYILRRAFDDEVLEEYRTLFSLTEDDLEDRGFTIIHKHVLGLLEADNFSKVIEKHRSIINVVDRTGRTAAHWAVLRNDAEKLCDLLKMGASPHIKDTTWGNTLLDYSVRLDSADLTKILLEFGAEVNSRTTCKWTPLYGCGTYRKSSIAEAHVENARLLIEHGAEVDARDEDGVDPLIKATRQEIPLLAAYLLDEAGAQINTCDNEGVSALAYAIRRQSFKTLGVLLDRGADHLVKDKKQNSILHAAAAEADLETLQILQRYALHGLNPDAKNLEEMTPTELATKREDVPEGFLPIFTNLCVKTRERLRQNSTKTEAHAAKTPSRGSHNENIDLLPKNQVANIVEGVDDSSYEEFEDAFEFNAPRTFTVALQKI